MAEVLIVVHLFVVLALVVVVLLQKSEGGGLGVGGGSGFMTARGTTNVLTRTTAILALIFFVTSFILSIIATQNRQPRSILDRPGTAAPAAPSGSAVPSGGGSVLDQLNQLRQGGAPAAAPPPPAAPAPSAPPAAPAQ